MKPSVPILDSIFRIAFVIVLTTLFLVVAAHAQQLIPTSVPTVQTSSANLSKAKPNFVPDPKAPKYKLIFPTDYDLKFFTDGKKQSLHPTETEASGIKKFIEQLNEAGAQGYRLVSAVSDSMAIVKLGNVPYEYVGFDSEKSYRFAAIYAPLAKQGFRLASQPLGRFDCVAVTSIEENQCPYYDLYLFEREKGVDKVIIHNVVYADQDGKPDVGIPADLNKLRSTGFYPVNVPSSYEVLFEQGTESNPRLYETSDIQIVKASESYWGRDDLPKKIKLLTEQGYRLALINYHLAVMYRPRGTARPVSYAWLAVGKRNWRLKRKQTDFQKQLTKLQENGAIYRMTYTGGHGDKNQLIFEENAVADGKRREYKFLKFELQAVENLADKKMHVELTPSSKDAWAEFARLVNDGFVVRDLVMTNEASVLLERTR